MLETVFETGPWWSLVLSCGASCGGPWWDWDEPRGRTRKKLPRIDWRCWAGFGASLVKAAKSIDEGVGVVVVDDKEEVRSSWSEEDARTGAAFPDLTGSRAAAAAF